jgi:hypothetical protein
MPGIVPLGKLFFSFFEKVSGPKTDLSESSGRYL